MFSSSEVNSVCRGAWKLAAMRCIFLCFCQVYSASRSNEGNMLTKVYDTIVARPRYVAPLLITKPYPASRVLYSYV